TWHVPEQPSPGTELPSSQTSGGWTMPSPQYLTWRHGAPWMMHLKPGSSWQSELQPSPETVLPSSHCSLSVTLPSPQTPPPVEPSGLLACGPPHAKKQNAVHKTSWRITHQITRLEKRLKAFCYSFYPCVGSPHR